MPFFSSSKEFGNSNFISAGYLGGESGSYQGFMLFSII